MDDAVGQGLSILARLALGGLVVGEGKQISRGSLQGPSHCKISVLGLDTKHIVASIDQPFVKAIARQGVLAWRDMATNLAATQQGRMDLAKNMDEARTLGDRFWNWLQERAWPGAR